MPKYPAHTTDKTPDWFHYKRILYWIGMASIHIDVKSTLIKNIKVKCPLQWITVEHCTTPSVRKTHSTTGPMSGEKTSEEQQKSFKPHQDESGPQLPDSLRCSRASEVKQITLSLQTLRLLSKKLLWVVQDSQVEKCFWSTVEETKVTNTHRQFDEDTSEKRGVCASVYTTYSARVESQF